VEIFPLIWLGVVIVAAVAIALLRPNEHITWLVVIVLLVAISVWISLPSNPGIKIDFGNDGVVEYEKTISVRQGLDLAGGLQVLLQADLPNGEQPSAASMNEVQRIITDRIDSTGALDPVIQRRGADRIIVELPGYQDPEQATSLIRETALLEFVELPFSLPEGTPILTDYRQKLLEGSGTTLPTETETPSATPTTSATETPDLNATPEAAGPVYTTIFTGDILQNADVSQDSSTGQVVVSFVLTPEGSQLFGDYTTQHVGGILGISLDGVIISAPTIDEAITGGTGIIRGSFNRESAERLATQLKYGALPVPLKIQSTSTVGPTLGQISVERSIRAGLIGITVVLLFMLIYYRLLGLSAALALLAFAVFNFALYKFWPITLTLPAITGFLISVGTAVDGNILIFERIKEELRRGRKLNDAVLAGFKRAWTSIRDSNFSTLIICAVLYSFGTTFGANQVSGFALTLALGLIINLFTATTVTRTFLHFLLLPVNAETGNTRRWLFGL
jgi:protein-export membrane protein SecD